MNQRTLLRQLDGVARRARQLRLWLGIAAVLFAGAAAGLVLLLLPEPLRRVGPQPAAILALSTAGAAILASLFALRSSGDHRRVARRIETRFPELDSRLLAAVEQEPQWEWGRWGYLQQRVLDEAVRHGHRTPWSAAVPSRWLRGAQATAGLGGACLAIAIFSLLAPSGGPMPAGSSIANSASEHKGPRYRVTIEPGNTAIERGADLLVMARFAGPMPDRATLLCAREGEEAIRLAMSRSLDDPLFGARLANIRSDAAYYVEFEQDRSPQFAITVFDYPELLQADAGLEFPGYTGMPARRIEDTRSVTAVEGTRLTWKLRLNKPVRTAELVGEEGLRLPLERVESGEPRPVYGASLTLRESRRFKVHLVDEEGREAREPAELIANATANRRPELKVAWPRRDMQVSPLEELRLKASAWDDFGLLRCGLSIRHAGSDRELVLGSGAGEQPQEFAHLVDLEAMQAEPDQLVSYFFWAEDVGPDGQTRRTHTDMYFAEVRHFEEIFRQGQQPPGGAQQGQMGGAAAEAGKLAELQKQIVSATWNLLRRRERKKTGKLADDLRVIHESQASVIEQAEKMAGKLRDAQSKQHLASALALMQEALDELEAARAESGGDALEQALSPERAAYQALLKLRAREHRVMRGSQQGGGGGGASGRSQQQLEQLELDNSENRYETRREASSAQSQQQRETRQVLNRLRELARRQKDLNERLKELQTALRQAEDEAEREEIRRRLKRLREQQQQILRDTDELKNRMQQPDNQRRMADAREQLDRTREDVRRASEALEKNRLSQAVTSGTRAGREFDELREKFRRQAAGRFEEEMREMSRAASELDKQQQRLSRQLNNEAEQPSGSLRGGEDRRKLTRQVERQEEDLGDLLQQMQKTVQESEQAEPLLSKQLYDTFRKARQQQIDGALEMTRQLLERGFADEARKADRQATEGIGELNRGVQRAAESVLGERGEALRRAKRQLDELAEQLNDEIAQSDPKQERRSDAGSRRGSESHPDGADDRRGSASSQQSESQAASPGEKKTSQDSGSQRSQERSENSKSPRSSGGDPDDPGKKQSSRKANGAGPPAERDRSSQSKDSQRKEKESSGSSSSPSSEKGRGDSPRSASRSENSKDPSTQNAQSPNSSNSSGQAAGGSKASDSGSQSANAQNPSGLRSGSQTSESSGSRGGFQKLLDAASGLSAARPLTGGEFREWSDGLRDVEEMLESRELRAEVARIRDRARGMRAEFKRHSNEPNWDLVRTSIAEPLAELQQRIAEELLRLESPDALVPIDRDPVPPQFSEQVRRYYEQLGSGR